jgi:hypothetical protein
MCWPELKTLCRWTCLSRASVKRALDQLEERRFLVRHRTGRATRYQLTLSRQRAHTEPSEVSHGAPESEGIGIEPLRAHGEPSAPAGSQQKAHTEPSAGWLPATLRPPVDAEKTAAEGAAAINSDASLEAQARATPTVPLTRRQPTAGPSSACSSSRRVIRSRRQLARCWRRWRRRGCCTDEIRLHLSRQRGATEAEGRHARGSDRHVRCDRASRSQAPQAERYRLAAHPGQEGWQACPAQAARPQASRKARRCRCC